MFTVFDQTKAIWTSHIAPDINPVPSDAYPCFNTSSGLVTLNQASKEMAGGLVSCGDCPIIVGSQYFGLDVDWIETAEDMPHKSRNEMDLKITLAGGRQANGSLQWNATKKMWQLDPTGSAWVDSGYTSSPVIGLNTMRSRFWTDGSKWSVLSLQLNGDAPFVPGLQFKGIPMINTTWGQGLHPQLQTEAQNVPWFLRTTYTRVWVLSSASAI